MLAFSLFSILFFANSLLSVLSFTPHRKFEYKLSFKGPHLIQRDGSIPFWQHGGHAIASEESVRITPSMRSKKGYVWSKEKCTSENWEIEVTFRISGRGRVGADGLAIWFTEEQGTEGPVFGSSDQWKGLGVFFDSFDNDNQHNNPYIMVMLNDGTKIYDHNTDGVAQQLGGCVRDFRNKPFPVKATIEYYQKTLTVMIHNGLTANKGDTEMCMRVENVELPRQGHFGISAATGGLADDHDVLAFLTHSLWAPTEKIQKGPDLSETEKKKYEQEFDEYWQKLERAKEEYVKEHPDSKPVVDEEDKWFEGQDIQELRMIFDGQNAIQSSVKLLHQKLDEIIGRQERTLSQLGMISSHGSNAQQSGTGGQPVYNVESIKRHEVDMVLNNQRELLQHSRDIRSVVDVLNNKGAGGLTAGGGQDFAERHRELKDHITNLQHELRGINRQQPVIPPCPEVTNSCVTPFYFFVFLAVQLAVMVGYTVLKNRKEAAAKKFY